MLGASPLEAHLKAPGVVAPGAFITDGIAPLGALVRDVRRTHTRREPNRIHAPVTATITKVTATHPSGRETRPRDRARAAPCPALRAFQLSRRTHRPNGLLDRSIVHSWALLSG